MGQAILPSGKRISCPTATTVVIVASKRSKKLNGQTRIQRGHPQPAMVKNLTARTLHQLPVSQVSCAATLVQRDCWSPPFRRKNRRWHHLPRFTNSFHRSASPRPSPGVLPDAQPAPILFEICDRAGSGYADVSVGLEPASGHRRTRTADRGEP